MATSAITPLASLTLASAQTTVTFSSISSAYKDLKFVINGKSTTSAVSCLVTVNGNVGSSAYTTTGLEVSSTLTQGFASAGFYGYIGTYYGLVGTSALWNGVADFLDYATTNKVKAFVSRYGSSLTGSGMSHNICTQGGTGAITSVAFTANGDTWTAGSTFTLYGINA